MHTKTAPISDRNDQCKLCLGNKCRLLDPANFSSHRSNKTHNLANFAVVRIGTPTTQASSRSDARTLHYSRGLHATDDSHSLQATDPSGAQDRREDVSGNFPSRRLSHTPARSANRLPSADFRLWHHRGGHLPRAAQASSRVDHNFVGQGAWVYMRLSVPM